MHVWRWRVVGSTFSRAGSVLDLDDNRYLQLVRTRQDGILGIASVGSKTLPERSCYTHMRSDTETQPHRGGVLSYTPPPPLPKLSRLNIPPQPPQPLLRPLQHLIVLTHRKPQPVLHNMRIRIREKLRRRNRRNAQLFDAEPAELEIPRAIGDVGRERVVGGEFDFGKVHEDEVAAFWV